MEVVDSQVHLWAGGTGHGSEMTKSSFGYEELLPLMDGAGVSRAVLVPPASASDRNDSCLAAARAMPDRFTCMGILALDSPETRGTLARFKAIPGMMGPRLALRREPYATWLVDGTLDWFWREAADAGMTVMVYCPGRLDVLAEKVAGLSGIRIIVDHMGLLPTARGAEREEQLAGMERVARLPNFAIKVSALPLYSDEPYPHRDVEPIVRRVVSAFGAERSFWGSDFTRLKCTYPEAVQMMTEGMPFLRSRERELVAGGAILDWLGWE